jgi:hypothetical protein
MSLVKTLAIGLALMVSPFFQTILPKRVNNLLLGVLNLLNQENVCVWFCFRQEIGEICGVEACLARLL